MIRIPQHGAGNGLHDILQFLPDIDLHFSVDSWLIQIDWCLGENAQRIEEQTEQGREYSDVEFRALYGGIYQTVDGSFSLKVRGEEVARLLAVDSTFWEIESKDRRFKRYMEEKYGTFEAANRSDS